MKKHYILIASIIIFIGLWSCEKTEIFLNDKGNPADLTGTWITRTSDVTGFISKTYYLGNIKEADGDQTYRDTVVVDSIQLTFVFGEGLPDSARVTSEKRVNGVYQAPVNLPAGRWRYALGASKGEVNSGVKYFNIFDLRYPNNSVVTNNYALVYTYTMLSSTSMEIKWLVSNNSPQNTQNFRAVLNKQ